jgi:hypothetical protein
MRIRSLTLVGLVVLLLAAVVILLHSAKADSANGDRRFVEANFIQAQNDATWGNSTRMEAMIRTDNPDDYDMALRVTNDHTGANLVNWRFRAAFARLASGAISGAQSDFAFEVESGHSYTISGTFFDGGGQPLETLDMTMTAP